METPLQRLTRLTRELAASPRPPDILGAASREVIALSGAHRVLASACVPSERWEHGAHVETNHTETKSVDARVRSALFAVFRRLAKRRAAIDLVHGEHEVVFRSLGCGPGDSIHAVPVFHEKGRLWGALVLIAPARACPEELDVLAQLVAVALANAQRLAFARRDQDRLRLLAEATDDALYDWKFESDFWWGGGIVDLVGAGTEQVENTVRWKLDRIHPEDLERTRRSLDAARFSKAGAWHCEYRFRRHNGDYIPVEDRCYFLRDASGTAYRVIGSMRDMTRIKELLAREREARAEAESANRSKDEFLAMLGHELRNPLAPIVTGLQLVRMRGGGAFERELSVLERQAQHIVRLVDDLLDVSRIAHKKIELKTERVELAIVVHAAIETARPLIERSRHELAIDVPPQGLEVIADRDRLAQAISNLLTNAAKYTAPGGRIAIRASRDGARVVLAVRDNGVGIDPEMVPRVFHKFVQVRQELDRAQGGLGLGLSIVRSLVELHHGTVSAASDGRGHGSEFTIVLPAAAAPLTTEARSPAPREASRVTGRRILVVDDNEDAADLLAALIERLGNTVRVAHDGAGALAVAEDFGPELAVLDIGLPDIDGYELARRLRLRPGRRLRLIALTGYGQASDRDRAAEAGFDAHLVKPIAIDALEAVVEKLLPSARPDAAKAAE